MTSYFNGRDGAGVITLPFTLGPQGTDHLPLNSITRDNTQFLNLGEDGAPWPGYYARFRGVKIAIEQYGGVWFEIKNEAGTFRAIRVARPALNLVHEPENHMNIDGLRAQTVAQGTPTNVTANLPAITGFTTTPTTPAVGISTFRGDRGVPE